jgi:aryl-alcohol dehydrogenase-like predicted oxidoreductase
VSTSTVRHGSTRPLPSSTPSARSRTWSRKAPYAASAQRGRADTVRRAAVAPISDLQIEYSLLSREIEDEILPTCQELGIGITAYGVLSRGLIGGSRSPEGFRAISPRFQGANREHDDFLVARLRSPAAQKGAFTAQLAIERRAARTSCQSSAPDAGTKSTH